MKTVEIQKIERLSYSGLVYNLEIESNSSRDDLFWIEQKTGIVTHNCFPKDVCSLIAQMEKLGFDPKMLKASWEQNKQIRGDIDW